MFGLGFAEVILIAVLALIFIGPKQLPDVARVIARLLNEWKRATSDFSKQFREMHSDLNEQVERNTIHPMAAASAPPKPSSTQPPTAPVVTHAEESKKDPS
jgi:sec-independent protein translocase protein TatB